MTPSRESELLAEGIRAAKQGMQSHARELLTQVLAMNVGSELAWLWMSSVLDTPAHRRDCLIRVLKINPNNEIAQRGLATLQSQLAVEPPPVAPPTPAAPVVISDPVTCPFCQAQTDATQQDCVACGEHVILSCPTCDSPVHLWETTRCPCGEGLRHYIFFPDGIDHEGLGQRYAMAERWEAAARQWDRALHDGSHISMLHRKLAQAYDKIGKTAEAQYHRQVATT